MEIIAKFIGTNSVDYENGKHYNLKVADFGGMSVRKMNDTGVCPYESLSAFLKNWTNITKL